MLTLRKTLTTQSLLRPITRSLTTQTPDEPSSLQYDELINAAGREKDFTTVGHLLYKRWRDGFFTTNHTFKFISTDTSILDDLLPVLSRLDKGFARKSAYDSLVSRLAKLNRTEDALRVVREMVSGNFGANSVTINPIIAAFTKKKRLDEAWRILNLFREMKIPPDVSVYNYFLTAYCVEGDMLEAVKVLEKMEEEGMAADSRTYDALVLGACKVGKVEGALAVLRRMVDDDLPVLYSTHSHVIRTMLKLGYYKEALEFVLIYGGKDKALDTENLGILASHLIDSKKLDEAKFVVKEMNKRGLKMGEKLKTFSEMSSET